MKDDLLLVRADARRLPLADESVQCIVTSPPYWGLRKYAGAQDLVWDEVPDHEHVWAETSRSMTGGTSDTKQGTVRGCGWNSICGICGAWRGAFGLEPTIELYVAHTVEILRECRRVLRSDGVLFWNIGDSYSGGDRGRYEKSRTGGSAIQRDATDVIGSPHRLPQLGIKAKDLCLIPARVALAAQADGWWVRSKIIWFKPNPMPESCRDRPTDAYEHILMLTKSARYFFDAFAVREPAIHAGETRVTTKGGFTAQAETLGKKPTGNAIPGSVIQIAAGRNLRNVWTFATQPYKGAHFATFPEDLPRRCILAATSERGACAQCGSPWERVTRTYRSGLPLPHDGETKNAEMYLDGANQLGPGVERDTQTIGWIPGCACYGTPLPPKLPDAPEDAEAPEVCDNCNGSGNFPMPLFGTSEECEECKGSGGTPGNTEWLLWKQDCERVERERLVILESMKGKEFPTAPCVVLDPFGGSGTTGRVAVELNRRAVSVDLAYHDLSDKRTRGVQKSLPKL